MKEKYNPIPDLSIEKAREMITNLQRQAHTAVSKRNVAQSVAFDLLFKDFQHSTDTDLKAECFNAKEELRHIAIERDKLKVVVKQLRAENKAFRETFKLNQMET